MHVCTVENTGQFYWPKLPVDDENDDDDDGRLNPWCANSIFFFLQTHILLAACKQRKPTHTRTHVFQEERAGVRCGGA